MQIRLRRISPIVIAITFLCSMASGQTSYVFVDLNPAAGTASNSFATASGLQVGQIWTDPTSATVTPHAAMWSGSAASYTDMQPAGATKSAINGTDGLSQVGIVDGNAALWQGSVASFVNLHPAGFLYSFATAVSGNTQVGCGDQLVTLHGGGITTTGAGPYHALIWTGSAASVVDLQPGSGFDGTCILGLSGSQQVGYGLKGGTSNAVLWNGTAKSIVNLHPSSFYNFSQAFGTDGVNQVGFATYDVQINKRRIGHSIAIMWSGTAASATFLGPTGGFQDSVATGIGSGHQVGYLANLLGGDASVRHAFVWTGNASAGVDLHQFAPAGYVSSMATSIDPVTGVITGSATSNPADNTQTHAVMWIPIP